MSWKHLQMRSGPAVRSLVLLGLFAVLGGQSSVLHAQDLPEPESTVQASVPQPPAPMHGGFIGGAVQWQSADGALRGFRLSNGYVAEAPYKRGVLNRGELDAWLSRSSTDEQAIWSVGIGGELQYALALGPVRAYPRGLLGIEYRTDEPDQGVGVVLGLAVVVEVWVGRHFAISLALERRFSLPGDDRTQLILDTRIVDERIGYLIGD